MQVVVIGGSAGALDVLLRIVRELRPATPIAVVLHQSPGHPSLLAGLLARESGLPVREPEDKERLEPGVIFVAPVDYHMLLERDGSVSLSLDAPVRFSRPSIDVLFESAAAAFGRDCVGIVLSGANDDGARGLRAIATAGGVTVVQAPSTADYPHMPQSALEFAMHVLAPSELARFVGRVGRRDHHEG